GGALAHLGERPVRASLAVGKAAAGKPGRALDDLGELVGQAALADARLAIDREQVRAAVTQGTVVRVLQQLELRLATDERRLERARSPTAAPVGAESAPGPDGLRHALQLDRAEVLDLDATQRQPVRGRAEQELAGLGRLLEPRGQRNRLSRGERRLAVLGNDLARLDADPRLELELFDRVEDRQPGADRPLGVVLVGL